MNFNNNNQPRLKLALLLSAMLLLGSCAALDSSSPPNSTGAASPKAAENSRTPSNNNNQTESVVAIENPVNLEQQQLINEINRQGVRAPNLGLGDSSPAPVSFEGENVVELNYEQAELRIVLEELAEALDITITIDPTIDDKVSIRTAANRPLAIEDVWPLLRMLSRDAGVLIEQIGNVYNARKVQTNLPTEIVTADTLAGSSAALLMQVTPLTYISAEAAKEVVSPILGSADNVRQLVTNNTLIITANEFELDRINQLLMLVDADPFINQGIQLFQLSNANAEEVATELSEILLLIEGATPSYQVKGIERINSILVTAPAGRGFDEIQRWVKILDAESQEQVEQLFYYKVRNLNATELADTLDEVFDIDDGDSDQTAVSANEQLARFEALGQTLVAQGPENDQNTSGADDTAVAANLRVRIVDDEATNSLLIRSTARDYRQLLTTINRLDTVPLQVMISAVIAQITLSDGNEFGVDWSRIAANSTVDPISTETTTDFLPVGGVGGLLFNKSFIDGAARIDATLAAISSNNEVRLLARPTITVANNQEGDINIGSNVPVLAGQTVTVNGIVNNVQYRDAGIQLTITPQINSDGIVNLEITQKLSSVDSGAVGVEDNPIFNEQTITTTVVVRDGENVVLGGLIQTDDEDLNTGVPGLNRVPVLGKLFSYQQRQTRKQELFIVLRPEVIDLNSQTSLQYSEILDRFELVSRVLNESERQNNVQ